MRATPGSSARSGVFISYSRKDGEAFARELRKKLEAGNISLWQDRTGMEGGRDWWEQIRDALDHVEFMVLVMTPGALASDVVRKEWRYARQQGVCVYPVIAAQGIDIGALPRWMNTVHWYDLAHQEDKFFNDLKTRCQVRRVPFMAGSLPEDFVARPAEFGELKSRLLTPDLEEPVAITAALRGAGGYGKTVLARALCHDDDIQNAFDDGILWVTLGERPSPAELIGKLVDLIEVLSDERPGFQGIDAAGGWLQELLAERDILLVIDDVWRAEDLRPFLQGGTRCARLVTTRRADTLPGNARKVSVDEMRNDEARQLIAYGLPAGGEEALLDLARRLGEWPLLLKLANAMLRKRVNDSRQPLADAIRTVNAALTKRGVTAFDPKDAAQRNDAVARTLEASVAWLSGDDAQRLQELAVFAEDLRIPLGVLERFWGHVAQLDEIEVEDICQRLFDASLLVECDLAERIVRLHDTIRAWLIERLDDAGRAALHDRLLESYLPSGGAWADVADDGYLYLHLADHLIAAGRIEELVATVRDPRYIVAKVQAYPTRLCCEDLVRADRWAGSDEDLQVLSRSVVQAAHLLDRCRSRTEVQITLASRLAVALPAAARQLQESAVPPYVAPIRPLPDLPVPSLIRTLAGHSGSVTGCAISPDGQWIVSASADTTLKVWDAKSGQERLTLAGHSDSVTSCAISPDGQWIISASADTTLKVWDAKSAQERLILAGHSGSVTGCAISPDGQWIVSASADTTLKVWDAKSGHERLTLVGHSRSVSGCAVSPDGQWIVSASWDHTLKVWDARSGQERLTLAGHSSSVSGCAVSPDGQWIVSASDDNTLKVWDAKSGQERPTLAGHSYWVTGCAISPDGQWIVSASWDTTLKVWDAQSGQVRLTLAGHSNDVTGCAISSDGQWIVSASEDKTLKVWNAKGGQARLAMAEHSNEVSGCAISPDGQWIVSASWDTTLKVWAAQSGQVRLTLAGHASGVSGCAISPDGQWIVSASADTTLKVWYVKSGQERLTLAGHSGPVTGCAISPDGQWIVSASRDATLKIWDVRSGQARLALAGHSGPVTGCAISPDGQWIVSASWDQTLKVWDAKSGQERLTLAGHSNWVNSCAISPDGQWIVSASWDETLKVWNVKSGKEELTLAGHSMRVSGCAISPDGQWIGSASADTTLKVWDARTGTCVATMWADAPLHCCAWDPSSHLIVAGGTAGLYWLEFVA